MSDPNPQHVVLAQCRVLPNHRQVRHGVACIGQEPLITTELIMANSLTERVRSALSLWLSLKHTTLAFAFICVGQAKYEVRQPSAVWICIFITIRAFTLRWVFN